MKRRKDSFIDINSINLNDDEIILTRNGVLNRMVTSRTCHIKGDTVTYTHLDNDCHYGIKKMERPFNRDTMDDLESCIAHVNFGKDNNDKPYKG